MSLGLTYPIFVPSAPAMLMADVREPWRGDWGRRHGLEPWPRHLQSGSGLVIPALGAVVPSSLRQKSCGPPLGWLGGLSELSQAGARASPELTLATCQSPKALAGVAIV